MESAIREKAEKLEREYRLLESLEGYKKLTEQQQNIIRGSLLVQKWAEIAGSVPESEAKNYMKARTYASVMFCYAAVAALERGTDLNLNQLTDVPSEFYMAEYEQVPDLATLDRKVADTGFPCVVLTGNGNPMTVDLAEGTPREMMHHACLALGRDPAGNIIVWEKEGGELKWPFRLTTLQAVYEHYEHSRTHWATRFLRQLEG